MVYGSRFLWLSMAFLETGGILSRLGLTIRVYESVFCLSGVFYSLIRFRVGSAERIHFWLDPWVGSIPLASQFPTLFGCASDKSALVSDYLSSSVGQTVRGPICRRNLLSGGDRISSSVLHSLKGLHSRWGGWSEGVGRVSGWFLFNGFFLFCFCGGELSVLFLWRYLKALEFWLHLASYFWSHSYMDNFRSTIQLVRMGAQWASRRDNWSIIWWFLAPLALYGLIFLVGLNTVGFCQTLWLLFMGLGD